MHSHFLPTGENVKTPAIIQIVNVTDVEYARAELDSVPWRKSTIEPNHNRVSGLRNSLASLFKFGS